MFSYTTPTNFTHHRNGWKAASDVLQELHNPHGIILYDWADKLFKEPNTIKHPWVGILHNVLKYPKEYPIKYNNRIHSLTKLVEKDYFQQSLLKCKGIFTLSFNVAEFLKRHIDVPVSTLTHPVIDISPKFNWDEFIKSNKTIYMIGQWLRKYHSICNLKTNYKKVLLTIENFMGDYKEMKSYSNNIQSVTYVSYLNNDLYDKLFENSIVFLDLYDAAACNVVLECIIKNTPILINLLPGTVEYLGPDYPLFFEDLNEAQEKLENLDLIRKAHIYLTNMDKTRFSPSFFKQSVVESDVYQNLSNLMPKIF